MQETKFIGRLKVPEATRVFQLVCLYFVQPAAYGRTVVKIVCPHFSHRESCLFSL